MTSKIIALQSFCRISLVPLVCLLSACQSGHNDVYLYYGINADDKEKSYDGIFNDFESSNGSLSGIWWDIYSERQSSQELADVSVKVDWVDDIAKQAFKISFNRQGYGANITVNPDGGYAENIVDDKHSLSFKLKGEKDVCVGIRYMESDGEFWMYGTKLNEYIQFCPKGSDEWVTHHVDLDSKQWVFFPYSGNLNLGNKKREKRRVVKVVFEVGKNGNFTLKKGEGQLYLDDIRLASL